MKEVIESIKKRYCNQNGKIVHHGDCHIYHAFNQICTCGLMHDLIFLGSEKARELFPKFDDDMDVHYQTLAYLSTNQNYK